MSFAEDVRTELSKIPVKKPCCRRALTAGLLLSAQVGAAHQVVLKCRSEATARQTMVLLEKGYGRLPEECVSGSHGHVYHTISISSAACARLVRQMQDVAADWKDMLHLFDCEGCRSAFLRGVFLACGTMTDPQKAFHMEFLLPNLSVAEAFSELLSKCGYPPRRIARGAGVRLYYKEYSSIEDVLALMGANQMLFKFYDMQIARAIRNNENRATNCVARNIEKSIAAATRQMEAIGILMETGKLEALPEPLRETALLRYRNPDATLDELKDLHVPPISKSGLNHRLQKLMDAAER